MDNAILLKLRKAREQISAPERKETQPYRRQLLAPQYPSQGLGVESSGFLNPQACSPAPHKPIMVAQACNPRIWEQRQELGSSKPSLATRPAWAIKHPRLVAHRKNCKIYQCCLRALKLAICYSSNRG